MESGCRHLQQRPASQRALVIPLFEAPPVTPTRSGFSDPMSAMGGKLPLALSAQHPRHDEDLTTHRSDGFSHVIGFDVGCVPNGREPPVKYPGGGRYDSQRGHHSDKPGPSLAHCLSFQTGDRESTARFLQWVERCHSAGSHQLLKISTKRALQVRIDVRVPLPHELGSQLIDRPAARCQLKSAFDSAHNGIVAWRCDVRNGWKADVATQLQCLELAGNKELQNSGSGGVTNLPRSPHAGAMPISAPFCLNQG